MDLKVILALALNLYLVQGDCPDGFVAKGNSCYWLSHEVEVWMNAKMICEKSLQAQLVEINDAAEDKIVKGLVGTDSFWIGHDDIEAEGAWKYASSGKPATYSNWNPGEPNNWQKSEDCAAILSLSGSPAWYDAPCSTDLYYICEKPLNPTE